MTWHGNTLVSLLGTRHWAMVLLVDCRQVGKAEKVIFRICGCTGGCQIFTRRRLQRWQRQWQSNENKLHSRLTMRPSRRESTSSSVGLQVPAVQVINEPMWRDDERWYMRAFVLSAIVQTQWSATPQNTNDTQTFVRSFVGGVLYDKSNNLRLTFSGWMIGLFSVLCVALHSLHHSVKSYLPRRCYRVCKSPWCRYDLVVDMLYDNREIRRV